MHVDCKEEQRCAVGVHVTQQPAAIHVAHDMLNRCKRLIDMRGVMHGQHDAGHDLHHQTYCQDDAPDPHPVQVFRSRDRQGRMQQPQNGKPRVNPLLDASFWLVRFVRNSAHLRSPQPSLIVSQLRTAGGTGRFSGAGPLRIRPAVS